LLGFGPGALLSWKETSSTSFAKLEPCIAATLVSFEDLIHGNLGFKGDKVAENIFEKVDFIDNHNFDISDPWRLMTNEAI